MGSRDDRAPSSAMTLRRRQDRAADEMLGLCRGLLADGHVSQQEAEFLRGWIERNAEFVGNYPFNRIYTVLSEILADGVIDSDESADLHDTLIRFVGGEAFDANAGVAAQSSLLPVDDPEPSIVHSDRSFVVTGTFTFGARAAVNQEIQRLGGRVAGSPSRKTDFLIVGELGSRDWINSNAGRKILTAVELRDGGHPIAIVSERHWVQHL
ncbi:MAG: BRCT domain-containing protein, partial [Stenotrophomonas maltophilia]